ncbi:hypothetical protein D3C71_77500 [compost metagenome]
MAVRNNGKPVITRLPAPGPSLSDAFNIRDTAESLEAYVKLVLKLFKRHRDTPMVKPGNPIYAGDCFKTLSRAEARFIYRRDAQGVIALRPEVLTPLTKAGIRVALLPHDMIEKTLGKERLLTFAPTNVL